jgi:hypothetical protein
MFRWLFTDLMECEDLNTTVSEKARWGWAGRFALGHELERGSPLSAAPVVTSPVLQHISSSGDGF